MSSVSVGFTQLPLASVGITQSIKFYAIKDDQIPDGPGADKDLFVGLNSNFTLRINNGQTMQFRDVVVLGNLTISSADVSSSIRGSLVARNVFAPGNLTVDHAEVKCGYFYQPKNVREFKKELEETILDWFQFQKECSQKMGLKSILH